MKARARVQGWPTVRQIEAGGWQGLSHCLPLSPLCFFLPLLQKGRGTVSQRGSLEERSGGLECLTQVPSLLHTSSPALFLSSEPGNRRRAPAERESGIQSAPSGAGTALASPVWLRVQQSISEQAESGADWARLARGFPESANGILRMDPIGRTPQGCPLN